MNKMEKDRRLWAKMETGMQTSAREQGQVFSRARMRSWGGQLDWIPQPLRQVLMQKACES